ncbi:MAG TPA: ParB/RepB/Spo0J family partition protein [Thermoanaerobaculia bacterium]|nr:ParB/RepB/Spo0J family partition protein [Thermoanaerobaculia bacterium]
MRHTPHFVDELTNRHETPIGKMVPLSSIELDSKQPRTAMGDLSELAASIREKGILEPILVRPRPEPNAPGGPIYRIISGERRFRAAQEVGLFDVPVIEMDVTEQEALEIALVENLQRKDLTPFEEADGYRALAENHSYTHEQIAEAVGKSRTVVTEALSLLAMPLKVRQRVLDLGVSSKSLLLEVLKAKGEEEMLRLLDEVSRQGLSRDDLRRRLRNRDTAKGIRRKPYVFKFRSPDKTYSLALSFRQSTVETEDLIRALESILGELRQQAKEAF